MEANITKTMFKFIEDKKELYLRYKPFLSTAAFAANKFMERPMFMPDGINLSDRVLKRFTDLDDKRMVESLILIARTAMTAYSECDMDLIIRLFNNRLVDDDVSYGYDIVMDYDALSIFKEYVNYYLKKEQNDE